MTSRQLRWIVLFCCSTFVRAQAQDNSYSLSWKNGFKLERQDAQFSFKLGGRIMVDHGFFSQDDDLDALYGPLLASSGTEFRRGRMYISGNLYSNIEFKLQAEFVGGTISLKDAYLGIRDIPLLGTLRVGHLKEPLRLSGLTSSNNNTFMERSFMMAFSQTRNNGALIFNDFVNKRISYQLGYFRNGDANGNNFAVNDGYVVTGRVSGLPIHEQESKQLLHLGFGYSYRKPSTSDYRIAARPEAHLSTRKYVNTGLIEAVDQVQLTTVEAAYVRGSLTVQGEYMLADINARMNYAFHTYYGQVSYFLTGEHRPYKSSYGGFNRLKPKRNFSGKGTGPGAFEVALRYSYANLNDQDLIGGEQDDVTLGLNWYLNPATRIMFNHIWTDVKQAGKATVFQLRFQIDF